MPPFFLAPLSQSRSQKHNLLVQTGRFFLARTEDWLTARGRFDISCNCWYSIDVGNAILEAEMKTRKSHHFHIIDHDGENIRLWRSSDFADMFAVFPMPIKVRQDLCTQYPDDFVAGFPEDDEGMLVCQLCLAENPPL